MYTKIYFCLRVVNIKKVGRVSITIYALLIFRNAPLLFKHNMAKIIGGGNKKKCGGEKNSQVPENICDYNNGCSKLFCTKCTTSRIVVSA